MNERLLQITEMSQSDLNNMFNRLFAEIAELKAKIYPDEDTLLDKEQLCNMLGIKSTTVYNWSVKGILKPISIGGRVYYKRSDILKLVNNEQ